LSVPQVTKITQKQAQELHMAEEFTNRATLAIRALLESGAENELTGEPTDYIVQIPRKAGDRFVVPCSDAALRAHKLRQSVRRAKRFLYEADSDSTHNFDKATDEISALVRETVVGRRIDGLQAQNWSGILVGLRDHAYAIEITVMLWAAKTCAAQNLTWLSTRMFGVAAARACALA